MKKMSRHHLQKKQRMTQMRFETKDSNLFRGDYGVVQSFNLETKEVTATGEFEGYGATFGNIDAGGDVLMPGAFVESLKKIPAERVRMLYQHDSREVIGKYSEIREDQRGLYVKGRLFLKIQRGAEVHELMMEKAIDGLSIGYRTEEDEYDKLTGTRRLKSVCLKEVSVVTFPMNEMAGVTLVKHSGALPTEREFEGYLTRDAGYSSQQAKAIIAKGYKALLSERDAGSRSEEDGLAKMLRDAAAVFRA